jgi:hypothetical protein
MLDVTDAMLIDPVKHVDANPNRDWIFRDKVEIPLANPQLILFAMIRKLQSRADGLDKLVETLKMECRVSRKDTEGDNCEWWVKEVVLFLQATELLDQIDVDTTFLDAKRQATDRIDGADIVRKGPRWSSSPVGLAMCPLETERSAKSGVLAPAEMLVLQPACLVQSFCSR